MAKPPPPPRPDLTPKRGAFPTPREEIEKATPFVPDDAGTPSQQSRDADRSKDGKEPKDTQKSSDDS